MWIKNNSIKKEEEKKASSAKLFYFTFEWNKEGISFTLRIEDHYRAELNRFPKGKA